MGIPQTMLIFTVLFVGVVVLTMVAGYLLATYVPSIADVEMAARHRAW